MSDTGDLWIKALSNDPDRLPEIGHEPSGPETEARQQEPLPCHLCGELADLAFYAEYSWPSRATKYCWLDLCNDCADWTVKGKIE